MTQYLVVGAGNSGLATAAVAASKGHSVDVLSRRTFSKQNRLKVAGALPVDHVELNSYSDNLNDIMNRNGGSIPAAVVLACRGQDIADYAKLLAPVLTRESMIMIICACRFAAKAFTNTLLQSGMKHGDLPVVADMNTSPFVARSNGQNNVHVGYPKGRIDIAALSVDGTFAMLEVMQPVFGNLSPSSSSLKLNLQKLDDCVHIPLLITSWPALERTGNHNLYRDTSPGAASLVVAVDKERLRIAEAYGIADVESVLERYAISYGTSGPSMYEHFSQVKAYDNATISDHRHRYLAEDVPFGAVPLQSLAQRANVQTPLLDSFIQIANALSPMTNFWTVDSLGVFS